MEKLDAIWISFLLVGSATVITLAFTTADIFPVY